MEYNAGKTYIQAWNYNNSEDKENLQYQWEVPANSTLVGVTPTSSYYVVKHGYADIGEFDSAGKNIVVYNKTGNKKLDTTAGDASIYLQNKGDVIVYTMPKTNGVSATDGRTGKLVYRDICWHDLNTNNKTLVSHGEYNVFDSNIFQYTEFYECYTAKILCVFSDDSVLESYIMRKGVKVPNYPQWVASYEYHVRRINKNGEVIREYTEFTQESNQGDTYYTSPIDNFYEINNVQLGTNLMCFRHDKYDSWAIGGKSTDLLVYAINGTQVFSLAYETVTGTAEDISWGTESRSKIIDYCMDGNRLVVSRIDDYYKKVRTTIYDADFAIDQDIRLATGYKDAITCYYFQQKYNKFMIPIYRAYSQSSLTNDKTYLLSNFGDNPFVLYNGNVLEIDNGLSYIHADYPIFYVASTSNSPSIFIYNNNIDNNNIYIYKGDGSYNRFWKTYLTVSSQENVITHNSLIILLGTLTASIQPDPVDINDDGDVPTGNTDADSNDYEYLHSNIDKVFGEAYLASIESNIVYCYRKNRSDMQWANKVRVSPVGYSGVAVNPSVTILNNGSVRISWMDKNTKQFVTYISNNAAKSWQEE